MTVEERIEAALFGYLAEREFVASIPLSWPNVDFTPPHPPAPYVRVRHLPNSNRRFLLRGSDPHFRRGILSLTAVTPLRVGPSAATALAGAIAAQFPADLAIFGAEGLKVTVQAAPSVRDAFPADTSWNVLVSVLYQAFA